MKRILSILVIAVMLCTSLTVVTSAATADLVFQSVEGTAVIDGVKDDAYANALNLKMDQKGGGDLYDAPLADVYILNDAEYVYLLVEVTDANLDNTNAEVYAQDSVEIFWMDDNKQVQIRYRYDGEMSGAVEKDQGNAVALTDIGYNVEIKMPITDVLNNQLEMCLQLNDCRDGLRDNTCHITGNPDATNAYQRSNREAVQYDCWWTLTLAGEHADTRQAPEPVDESVYNWVLEDTHAELTEVPYGFQLFTMDNVNYSWVATGGYYTFTFGEVGTHTWTGLANSFFMTEELTAGYTKDPKFGMQVTDHSYLQLPAGAEVGDTGESAMVKLEYKDITIKAEGYADVIVPGAVYEALWTVKQENGYTSGQNFEIDFVKPIKEQLGLDTKGLIEYMLLVDEIQFEINLTEFNGVTYDELIAYEEVLYAATAEVLALVQPYVDEAEAALDAAKDVEGNDVDALNGYLATAQAAADNAVAAAGDNADAMYLASNATDAVEDIEKLITRAEKAIEEERIAAEEAAKAEAERIAEEEAAAKKTTTIVVIAVVAVVVVVAVILLVVLKKKKK